MMLPWGSGKKEKEAGKREELGPAFPKKAMSFRRISLGRPEARQAAPLRPACQAQTRSLQGQGSRLGRERGPKAQDQSSSPAAPLCPTAYHGRRSLEEPKAPEAPAPPGAAVADAWDVWGACGA